ncbi:MAG: glycosyltransferase [Pseudomonadota bacterium]
MPTTTLILISEAWFLQSHFMPLLETVCAATDRTVVATRSLPDAGEQARFLAELNRAGAEVIDLDAGRGAMTVGRQAASAFQMRKLIRDIQPDVMHAVGQHLIVLAGAAIRTLPRRQRPRFVMHLTGRGILATADGLRYRAMQSALRQTVRSGRKRGALLLVENQDDAREVGGQAPDNNTIFLSPGAGVDPTVFAPEPTLSGDADAKAPEPSAQAAHAVPVVGYVGRMLTFKGLLVLEAAAKALARTDAPIQVACYGRADTNPRAIAPDVLEHWKQSNGPMVWHGATTDVAAVWRSVDIAVFPTLGGEGVPRALLEAAASACPIIASDVPGCRDVIIDGETGLLVPPDDEQALIEAMARLRDDRALGRRLGNAARARVIEGFSETAVRAIYRRLYDKALGRT